jgi:hypothetical protein
MSRSHRPEAVLANSTAVHQTSELGYGFQAATAAFRWLGNNFQAFAVAEMLALHVPSFRLEEDRSGSDLAIERPEITLSPARYVEPRTSGYANDRPYPSHPENWLNESLDVH